MGSLGPCVRSAREDPEETLESREPPWITCRQMPPAPCYCRLSLAVIAAAAGPLLMALPPPAAAASAVSAAAAPTVVHVKDGRLVAGGTWVGTHTSQLAANVVAPLFPAVTAADWQETSMINATMGLRHLVLEGDYLADVPLSLPSLFVLQLLAGSTITPAANLSLQNTTTFTGLVQMHGSCQLAISPPPMPPRPPGQLALRIPCGAPGQLALRIPCGAPAHGQLVPATRQYRSRE